MWHRLSMTSKLKMKYSNFTYSFLSHPGRSHRPFPSSISKCACVEGVKRNQRAVCSQGDSCWPHAQSSTGTSLGKSSPKRWPWIFRIGGTDDIRHALYVWYTPYEICKIEVQQKGPVYEKDFTQILLLLPFTTINNSVLWSHSGTTHPCAVQLQFHWDHSNLRPGWTVGEYPLCGAWGWGGMPSNQLIWQWKILNSWVENTWT